MVDLSETLEDFLDEIRPHITSAKQSTAQCDNSRQSVLPTELVLSSLKEAANWAEDVLNEGKLYMVNILLQ